MSNKTERGWLTTGIDVSSWQGNINFKELKAAGYSFVIIKAGQGEREFKTFKDRYLPGVLNAGLDWGVYWWSDALTVDAARREADACINAVADLKPTFPVFIDQEYSAPIGKIDRDKNRRLRSEIIDAFCGVLENHGFFAGVYASKDWFEHWVDDSMIERYSHWVAQYSPQCTYNGVYGIWQYKVSGVNEVPGVTTAVDLNRCYVDYPRIIKSACLNGWCRNGV